MKSGDVRLVLVVLCVLFMYPGFMKVSKNGLLNREKMFPWISLLIETSGSDINEVCRCGNRRHFSTKMATEQHVGSSFLRNVVGLMPRRCVATVTVCISFNRERVVTWSWFHNHARRIS